MKLSIIVPVYYNADTLELMYSDLKRKVLDVLDFISFKKIEETGLTNKSL